MVTVSDVDNQWRSFSIFFYDYTNVETLVSVIGNAIDETYERKLKYFFNRLFDPGPVIKIRIMKKDLIELDINDNEIIDLITANVNKFLPQKSIDKDYFLNNLTGEYSIVSQKEKWPKNGTVINEKYIREIKRYGGTETIRIVEDFFVESTYLCKQFFSSKPSWLEKVHFSISLNKIILNKLEMNPLVLAEYLEAIGDGWLDYVQGKTDMFFNLSEMVESLIPRIEQVVLEENLDFVQYNYDPYKKSVDNILNYLNQNSIVCDPFPKDSKRMQNFINKNKEKFFFPRIAISLMHMNNNRLGIYLYSEPVLYYSLGKIYRRNYA